MNLSIRVLHSAISNLLIIGYLATNYPDTLVDASTSYTEIENGLLKLFLNFTLWNGNHLIHPRNYLHDDLNGEYYYSHMK